MYRVFVRNGWRMEGGVKVPDPGARKHTLAKVDSEEEAFRISREYNRTHKLGPLSRKAEVDEIR
jgi:hypothetical protein